LSDELPHAWEQNPIAIEGVVASVVETVERGERIIFDVEKILTKGAIVPKYISLNLNWLIPNDEHNDAEEDTEIPFNLKQVIVSCFRYG
jgi:competence protein ComEC